MKGESVMKKVSLGRFAKGVLAAALIGFLAAAPAAAQGPSDPPDLKRAIAAQEAHTDRLLLNDGVVGTGVGLTADGQAAVVIMTENAGMFSRLRSLNGVPVLIKVTGRLYAVGHKPRHNPGGDKPGEDTEDTVDPTNPTATFPLPVPIGVSTGNEGKCSAGTIGARVSDGPYVYALSNNHVYALENTALIGARTADDTDSDTILQAGTYDTGCTPNGNWIGVLYDYVDLLFDGSDNTIDAAIARSNKQRLGNATPVDGYGAPASTTVTERIGQSVQKYGRTTGLTTGMVTVINVTANVGYKNGTARFVGQILVDGDKGGFLKGGDSGSLLVENNANAAPVGLLFASGRGGKIAVANRIDDVLTAFGVVIDETL